MHRTSAAVLLSLAAIACSGKSPTEANDAPNGGGAAFAARVDGQQWSASDIDAFDLGGVVNISASDGVREITIGVVTQGTGTYGVATDDIVNVTVREGNKIWFASGELGSGSVTIGSLSASGVSGTFNFVAEPLPYAQMTETRTVTNGSFNIVF